MMTTRLIRRAMIVLGVAVLVCLSLATTASAKNPYVTWNPSDGENAMLADSTPHRGYTAGTVKCGVCHAVHNAPIAGSSYDDGSADSWTAESGAETQLMLRSSVADACTYCHISTAIGGRQIYAGDPTAYTTDNIFNHSSSSGALYGGVRCVDCHSVHGANTFGGFYAVKILKVLPTIQQEFIDDVAEGNLAQIINPDGSYIFGSAMNQDWPPEFVQQSAFCLGCHHVYSPASETTMSVTDPLDGEVMLVKQHPMKQEGSEAGNAMGDGFVAAGSTLPTDGPGPVVATMTSRSCRRCHFAGQSLGGPGLQVSSYPHYTPGAARFLVSAPSAWEQQSDAADPHSDGICTRCHRWYGMDQNQEFTVPTGVGWTY